jgi:hypothetical protein
MLLELETAHTVRSSFNRQCFPELFVDPGSAIPAFQALRSVESMPIDRFQTRNELEAAYRSRYEEITQKVIDAIGETAFSTTDPFGRKQPACRDCVGEFNHWMAEREELNAITKLQLSALLTAQQAEQLHNLLSITPSTRP